MNSNDIEAKLKALGVGIPEILLPADPIKLEDWAVIACDQFSSEPEYWKRCSDRVNGKKSVLGLIYPEAWYELEPDQTPRISAIHNNMKTWLFDGSLKPVGKGFVYLERKTAHVPLRKGLLLTLDLERYDFKKGSHPDIRPTEGTIVERIPPRMKIRDKAVLDLTHILVLVNDPADRLFSGLTEKIKGKSPLYNTELMEGGGSLTGWMIDSPDDLAFVTDCLELIKSANPFPFAVGDGNHSLATAREVWEKRKREGAGMDHPSRYALVEIENIHDAGMVFEPIHRVLFNTEPLSFESFMIKRGFSVTPTSAGSAYEAGLITAGKASYLVHQPVKGKLIVELVQEALDEFLAGHAGSTIDYIHGEESVRDLSSKKNTVGLLLPALDKGSFFDLIGEKGVLPRKAFSIGEAVEKRYYLEARKLIP
jgi:hypothetical protein